MKKNRCHVTLVPPHNGHLSITATSFCCQSGFCGEVWLCRALNLVVSFLPRPEKCECRLCAYLLLIVFLTCACKFSHRLTWYWHWHDRTVRNPPKKLWLKGVLNLVYSPPSPLNYFPITLLPSLLLLPLNISQHMFIGMKKNTKKWGCKYSY